MDSRVLDVLTGSRHVTVGQTWYQENDLAGFGWDEGDILALAYTGSTDGGNELELSFNYPLPHLAPPGETNVASRWVFDDPTNNGRQAMFAWPASGTPKDYHDGYLLTMEAPARTGLDSLVFPLLTSPVAQTTTEREHHLCWILARLAPPDGTYSAWQMTHNGLVSALPRTDTADTLTTLWDAQEDTAAYLGAAIWTGSSDAAPTEGSYALVADSSVAATGAWPEYRCALSILTTPPPTTGFSSLPDGWTTPSAPPLGMANVMLRNLPPTVRAVVWAQIVG